jgi:redox-sensitive bicupin YhaK (pirin superfamily)
MKRRQAVTGTIAALGLGAIGCASDRAMHAAPRTLASRGIARLIEGRASIDGAGVHLTRHLAEGALEALDPFVLLDEIHSANPTDYALGFPSHPHRGFETVSLMLDGRFRHRDSRGGGGVVVPGGAQWMTAGSGIVHSEMPEMDGASTELWGFQLWVNLPRAEKWRAPGYEEIAPDRVARVELDRGGVLRVTAGELLGARGPVAPRTTQPILATLRMAAGDDVELRIPRDHSAFVLAAEGSPTIGPRAESIREGSLAQLSDRGELVRIRSAAPSQLLLIAGAPIREPIAHGGPFVMNTQEEIEQAFADYRAGRLG